MQSPTTAIAYVYTGESRRENNNNDFQMTVMPFTKHLSNSSSNQFLIHELMAFHNVKKETYKSAGDIG